MSREQHVQDAVDRFLQRVRQDTDKHLQGLAEELLIVVRGDMRTSRTDLERAAVDVARAVARGGAQARHDVMSRLLVAVRRLDEASSLRGILDVLSDGAAQATVRMAVLVVNGSSLASYRQHGFPAGDGPIDVSIDRWARLGRVIERRHHDMVPGGAHETAPTLPGFLQPATGQLGLLIPLVVGPDVVAVVYGEGTSELAGGAVPDWVEQIEVLVRHAAVRLENVTSRRTVEVLTSPR